MWRRRVQSQRGAVIVEFAIVFPLLVMLILGMFTGGLAYNQKLQLTYATREGARFASTVPTNQSWTSGTWAENVRDLIIERAVGDLDGPGVAVCVSLVEGTTSPTIVGSAYSTQSGACDPTETFNGTTANSRRVQVRVQRPGKIELAVFPSINFTITATATAKSETNQ